MITHEEKKFTHGLQQLRYGEEVTGLFGGLQYFSERRFTVIIYFSFWFTVLQCILDLEGKENFSYLLALVQLRFQISSSHSSLAVQIYICVYLYMIIYFSGSSKAWNINGMSCSHAMMTTNFVFIAQADILFMFYAQ